MERNLTYIALFAALIAVLGLLPKLSVGFGAPITAQSLGIMLCGTILGARRGALAVLLFLGLVAIGLPLLAGGRGGLGVFATPWAGFLFGFPVAAFVTGLIVEKLRIGNLGVEAGIASLIGGILVLYAIATVYFAIMSDTSLIAASATMMIYVPGDLIKVVLAGVITAALYSVRPSAVLSRA